MSANWKYITRQVRWDEVRVAGKSRCRDMIATAWVMIALLWAGLQLTVDRMPQCWEVSRSAGMAQGRAAMTFVSLLLMKRGWSGLRW